MSSDHPRITRAHELATTLFAVLRRKFVWAYKHRCTVLFWFLVVYLLALPLVYASPLGKATFFAVSVALMISVIRSIWSRGWLLTVNIWMGLLYVILVTAALFGDSLWLLRAALAAGLLFIAGVMLALLRYVMDFARVTADKLFGAVTIYILIALLFAYIYHFIATFGFQHFKITEKGPESLIEWSDFLYFSFTVLTTTGFGEITPVSRTARSVVMIEQVTGVMYIAFLIARLTELYPRGSKS